MLNKIIKTLAFITCTLLLTACSGFFEKDNVPGPKSLTKITPEIRPQRLWFIRAGSGGASDEYLKMSPAISETAIFTASIRGTVSSIDKSSGHINWQVDTKLPISSGPGVGDGIVVVGTRKGDVIALLQNNGGQRWKTVVPGEILAKPAVSQGYVIVKAVDGHLRALSTQDGRELWSAQQVEPALILRGSSEPLIRDRNVIVGFANGNLSKFSLGEGQLLWMHPIAISEGAFAIQRMIDIDANPVVFEHHVYAATYQGKITKVDGASGRPLWSHDISSYTGMIADNNAVYISDAKSHVWAFDADSGLINWRQTDLDARIVSGPAIMGNYVIVGDAQGYLHWLSKNDGHFAARDYVGSAIYAAPIVENNVLYALTNTGYLAAYKLS